MIKRIGEASVSVSSMATKGGYILGGLSGLSLLSWLVGWGGLILSPFASILGIPIAAGLIWMGRRLGRSGRL